MAGHMRMGDHINDDLISTGEGGVLGPGGDDPPDEEGLPLVPWLDAGTARCLCRIVALIARDAPDARAAIMFGSVARREARSLADPHPSDVDLLVLFASPSGGPGASAQRNGDAAQADAPHGGLTARQHHILSWAVVRAMAAFPEAARDVQVTGAQTHFAGWDPQFVEHVARDGILLWARGPLPSALAPVSARTAPLAWMASDRGPTPA